MRKLRLKVALDRFGSSRMKKMSPRDEEDLLEWMSTLAHTPLPSLCLLRSSANECIPEKPRDHLVDSQSSWDKL